MVIKWDESLSVGIDEIDGQHKELIKKIDNLASAILKKEGKGKVHNLLNYMDEYAEFHFSCEEKYMEEHNYPETEKHKKEHNRFYNVVKKLKIQLKENGITESFALSIQQFLIDWLILHIQNEDGNMGKYLKEKIPEQSQQCEGKPD
ncbi:MAG: bacteriohemerythrin [Candidatus Heimdallarchaeaceae archaeon]|jgi:hemerythrin